MHSLEVTDKSKNVWCKHQIFVFVKRWMLSVLVKNVSGSLEKFGKKLEQEQPEKDQFGDREQTGKFLFLTWQSIKQYHGAEGTPLSQSASSTMWSFLMIYKLKSSMTQHKDRNQDWVTMTSTEGMTLWSLQKRIINEAISGKSSHLRNL